MFKVLIVQTIAWGYQSDDFGLAEAISRSQGTLSRTEKLAISHWAKKNKISVQRALIYGRIINESEVVEKIITKVSLNQNEDLRLNIETDCNHYVQQRELAPIDSQIFFDRDEDLKLSETELNPNFGFGFILDQLKRNNSNPIVARKQERVVEATRVLWRLDCKRRFCPGIPLSDEEIQQAAFDVPRLVKMVMTPVDVSKFSNPDDPAYIPTEENIAHLKELAENPEFQVKQCFQEKYNVVPSEVRQWEKDLAKLATDVYSIEEGPRGYLKVLIGQHLNGSNDAFAASPSTGIGLDLSEPIENKLFSRAFDFMSDNYYIKPGTDSSELKWFEFGYNEGTTKAQVILTCTNSSSSLQRKHCDWATNLYEQLFDGEERSRRNYDFGQALLAEYRSAIDFDEERDANKPKSIDLYEATKGLGDNEYELYCNSLDIDQYSQVENEKLRLAAEKTIEAFEKYRSGLGNFVGDGGEKKCTDTLAEVKAKLQYFNSLIESRRCDIYYGYRNQDYLSSVVSSWGQGANLLNYIQKYLDKEVSQPLELYSITEGPRKMMSSDIYKSGIEFLDAEIPICNKAVLIGVFATPINVFTLGIDDSASKDPMELEYLSGSYTETTKFSTQSRTPCIVSSNAKRQFTFYNPRFKDSPQGHKSYLLNLTFEGKKYVGSQYAWAKDKIKTTSWSRANVLLRSEDGQAFGPKTHYRICYGNQTAEEFDLVIRDLLREAEGFSPLGNEEGAKDEN